MEEKKICSIGNTKFEFEQIEKMDLSNGDGNVEDFTYGNGSFLTILCCKP